jgi:hypothetical protein
MEEEMTKIINQHSASQKLKKRRDAFIVSGRNLKKWDIKS